MDSITLGNLLLREEVKMSINVLHMAHLTIGYGVERQLLDHLALANRKPNEIKHHVCALRISDTLHQELKSLEIPYTINRLWPWNLVEFSNFVKEHDIQILHVHNQLRFPLRSRILPKLAGVPLIIEHEHGMVWNTTATRLIRLTNKLVSANICNSNAAKIMLKQKCGIDAQVIYNGVIIPAAEPETKGNLRTSLGMPEAGKIVGFVGRLNTPKGVEAFIRMIPLVKQAEPQAKFVVVGDGPLRDELQDLAVSLGVSDEVHFLGYQKEAREFMKQMEVVVVPSIREPFGNVVIEAALAKKAVVASNVDGIAETVVDGETGFLVDCTEPVLTRSAGGSRLPQAVVDGRTRQLRLPCLPNIEMLAEKVIQCLADPEMARILGERAYERATNLFAFERYRDELDEVYRELSNGSRK